MQQRELERDYFFEFAGMPQSGKSTVEDVVAHYLKGLGFTIEEYRGGSRYSPLRFLSIADLNVLLACKATEFVVSVSGREKEAVKKIFLMDRGLIDRYMFTETLLRQGKMDKDSAHATQKFLTSPHLVRNIDGVFVFVTTPELALRRENKNKLVVTEGGVMNSVFLTGMRNAVEDSMEQIKGLMLDKPFQLIDTGEEDGKAKEIAGDIAKTILDIISSSNRKVRY